MPELTISEHAFQKTIVDLLRLHDYFVAVVGKGKVRIKGGEWRWSTPFGADGKGFLDVFALPKHPRQPAWIWWELKSDGGRTSPEQDYWLSLGQLVQGSSVRVVRPEDWDEIVVMLR